MTAISLLGIVFNRRYKLKRKQNDAIIDVLEVVAIGSSVLTCCLIYHSFMINFVYRRWPNLTCGSFFRSENCRDFFFMAPLRNWFPEWEWIGDVNPSPPPSPVPPPTPMRSRQRTRTPPPTYEESIRQRDVDIEMQSMSSSTTVRFSPTTEEITWYPTDITITRNEQPLDDFSRPQPYTPPNLTMRTENEH